MDARKKWNRLGGHIRIPYVKSALAEAVALHGDVDAALVMIEECLEQIEGKTVNNVIVADMQVTD